MGGEGDGMIELWSGFMVGCHVAVCGSVVPMQQGEGGGGG